MMRIEQLAEQRIIESFEMKFHCMDGSRTAWFELPVRDGDPIRVIYVVYAVSGPVLADLEDWFFDEVIVPLYEKTGTGGYLYWRRSERVEVTSIAVHKGTNTPYTGVMSDAVEQRFKIYTRIAVLTNDLKEVRLDEIIKREGAPTKDLS